jgi:hypothetical protein
MAAAATVVSRSTTVTAQAGDPVILGQHRTTRGATRVTRSDSGPALVGDGTGPGIGVSGTSQTGIAVYGVAEAGQGVVGSSIRGSGVEAVSPHGIALRVRRGRVRYDGISGSARMAKGDSVALVRPATTIVPDAFVLLTPMFNLDGRDLWFTRQSGREEFAIRLSQPADEDLFIGWLMLG